MTKRFESASIILGAGRHRRPSVHARKRALLLGGLLAAAALVVSATPASAHPLGNFTVNRYARVELSAGVVRVYYVLDEAEIPAFEERAAVAADRAGFARRRAGAIASGLTLEVDNTRLPLDVEASDLSQPLGQGGLHTLRLAIRFHAALAGGRPDEPRTVGFADDNEPDRVGWREIVVTPRGDAHVLRTDAPSRDAVGGSSGHGARHGLCGVIALSALCQLILLRRYEPPRATTQV